MGPVDEHLDRLKRRTATASLEEVAGSGWLVRIPAVRLPAGWSKSQTSVVFHVPQGYPFAKLDSFWADLDLRLSNGSMPRNAQLTNPVPGSSDQLLWFSWHVEPWNPNRDDFVSWLSSIRQRLAQPT